MARGKHVQLADNLRKDILSGKYGTEGGLPAASELATKYGLALNTVKAALAHLEGERIIVKRGIGYYVNQISTIMTEYVPLLTVRMPEGTAYYEIIGGVEEASIPEHLALKFKVSGDRKATFRVQVSGEVTEDGKKPLKLTYRYHLMELSSDDVRRMEDEPAYDPLAYKEEYACKLFSSDEVVPRLITHEEQVLLGLPEGTPVMHLFEAISKEGEILMIQEVVLSPRESLIFAFPFDNKTV